MYKRNKAYLDSDGVRIWLFEVISGVLQGCPLSGSLFVIAIDPLLFLFKHKVEDLALGRLRACADDIGTSLCRLEHIGVIKHAFDSFKPLSGLRLKPQKCVLILTTSTADEHNTAVVRQWLRVHCPGWCNFQMANTGKYLGFCLGPKSSLLQWKEPLEKFKARVSEAKASSVPTALAGSVFASRAVSVLGYKAQLVPPPPTLSMLSYGLPINSLACRGLLTPTVSTGLTISMDPSW